MKQAMILRTNAGGFAMLMSENLQAIQQMASFISKIIAAVPPLGIPSAEDYKRDIQVISSAQQHFGLENVSYFDYRWQDEESIKKALWTGEWPELGKLPIELLEAL
jgi:hypothetical protein